MSVITPREHQAEAVKNVSDTFMSADRATIVMPCGTGKTMIGPWVGSNIGANRVVIFVPTLWLMRQTIMQWRATDEWASAAYFGVCSDKKIFDDLDISEMSDAPVTTDPAAIREILDSLPEREKSVVCCTYQSSDTLAGAIPEGFFFDYGVFDEAHCTAAGDGWKAMGFTAPLHDDLVPIHKRLFMTATPKVFESPRVGQQKATYSMDNREIYGERAYELPFSRAVEMGIITDYLVVVSVITKQELTRGLLRSRALLEAQAKALYDSHERYGVEKCILFFNTIKESEDFADGPVNKIWPDAKHLYVSSALSADIRSRNISELAAPGCVTMSNARCLTMGVDVPAVDMVGFMRRKRGEIDIIQAMGRAVRKNIGKPGKTGYIFLPIFLDDIGGESISDAILSAKYNEIWSVIDSIRSTDEQFDCWFRLKSGGVPESRIADIGGVRKISFNSRSLDASQLNAIESLIVSSLRESWDEMFSRLVAYKDNFGHCNVPKGYVDANLSAWVRYQRKHWESRVSSRKKLLLRNIGFDPDPMETAFNENYQKLERIFESTGSGRIPALGHDLSYWAAWLRRSRKMGSLPPDKIAALDAVGFAWSLEDEAPGERFDRLCNALREHVARGGFGDLGRRSTRNAQKNIRELGEFLQQCRARRVQGRLSDAQIEALDKAGIVWDVLGFRQRKNAEELLDFFRGGGELLYGSDLYEKARSIKRTYARGFLRQDILDMLRDTPVFSQPINVWEVRFDEMKRYFLENNTNTLPYRHSAYGWAKEQRQRFLRGTLPIEQEKKLRGINFELTLRQRGFSREEDEVIMSNKHMTAKELSALLPGKSVKYISKRKLFLTRKNDV